MISHMTCVRQNFFQINLFNKGKIVHDMHPYMICNKNTGSRSKRIIDCREEIIHQPDELM